MAAIIKLSQNEWVNFFCTNGGQGSVSEVFLVQTVGTNPGKCEWVWEEKLRWLNPTWLNSRWLPSSNWVRMNEFESDWISLSQSFVQNGWIQDGRIQDGRIQDGCHHQVNQIEFSLSQSQSGGRVFLSKSERRKQGVWIQHGRIQDGCHNQVESEWMSEVFLIQHGRIQDGCHQ